MSFSNTLLAKLGLDNTQFNRGLQQSESRTKRFSKSVTGAFMRIAGPVLAVGTVVALGRAAIEMGDQIDRAALKAGIGVEEFQKLGYAARQNKSNFEELEKGLVELNKRMGETPEKFEKFGISLKDANGNQKTTTQVLAEVADAMKNAGTQAERTAIANQLMSESGVKLIPTLQQGSQYLGEMADKAEELGQVMSESTVKGLAEAKQAMDDFKTSATVITGNALIGLRDLVKTVRGQGLNEDHDTDIKIRKQVEEEITQGYNRVFKNTQERDANAIDRLRDRDLIKEQIEQRINEIYHERLLKQKQLNAENDKANQEEEAAARRQAAWDEANAKTDKLEAERAKAKAEEEERITNEKKLQDMYAEGVKRRELERASISEQIRANEEEISKLRALAKDEAADHKDREQAVKDILSLEEKNLSLLERQREEIQKQIDTKEQDKDLQDIIDADPESDEAEKAREQLAERERIRKLRETARADPTGKTVAGREAIQELKKAGELSKQQNDAFHQIKENRFTDVTKAGLQDSDNHKKQFEGELFKNLQAIERILKGKYTNQ